MLITYRVLYQLVETRVFWKIEMTESSIKKDSRTSRLWPKIFLVYFYLASGAMSVHVPQPAWNCGFGKVSGPRARACTLSRGSAEVQILRTQRGEFHLQPFTGAIFADTSCGARCEHKLECCPALFVLRTLAVTPHWPGRGHFLGFHVISVTGGQNSFVHTYCTLVWARGKQWTETVIFL